MVLHNLITLIPKRDKLMIELLYYIVEPTVDRYEKKKHFIYIYSQLDKKYYIYIILFAKAYIHTYIHTCIYTAFIYIYMVQNTYVIIIPRNGYQIIAQSS